LGSTGAGKSTIINKTTFMKLIAVPLHRQLENYTLGSLQANCGGLARCISIADTIFNNIIE
jgi:hypothetical protein